MSELVMTRQASPGALGAGLESLFFDVSGVLSWVGNDGVIHIVPSTDSNPTFNTVTANQISSGIISCNQLTTVEQFTLGSETAANVGNVTMNTPSGRVSVEAGSNMVLVTNSLVTEDSHVFAIPSQNDSTGTVISVVPATGNFSINLVAPTANMTVDFIVFNTPP